LRSRTLTTEQKAHITREKEAKERVISDLAEQRKLLEKDIPLKRKIVSDRKKELQKIQDRKKNSIFQSEQTLKTSSMIIISPQWLTMEVN